MSESVSERSLVHIVIGSNVLPKCWIFLIKKIEVCVHWFSQQNIFEIFLRICIDFQNKMFFRKFFRKKILFGKTMHIQRKMSKLFCWKINESKLRFVLLIKSNISLHIWGHVRSDNDMEQEKQGSSTLPAQRFIDWKTVTGAKLFSEPYTEAKCEDFKKKKDCRAIGDSLSVLYFWEDLRCWSLSWLFTCITLCYQR